MDDRRREKECLKQLRTLSFHESESPPSDDECERFVQVYQEFLAIESRNQVSQEQLEQEKHRLKRELEVMEEEYEQRISDLQADLNQVRSKITEAEVSTRSTDRERQSIVTSLSDQNQRLTSELQAAGRREEELQNRLSELRNQVNDKRMSMQDHVLYLENLKEEVAFVTRRKNELEKRVEELIGEREQLNSTLEETSDKIVMLERHAREQDCQLQGSHREMSELRTNNQILSERLESISRSYSSSSPSSVQISLLNEMEMSTSGSDSDRSLYHNKRPCSQIDEEIEDIDEVGGCGGGGGGGVGKGLQSNSATGDDSEMTCISAIEFKQLKEEVVSAQQQLKTLCSQLRQSQHGSSASASLRMPRGHASLNSAGGEAGSASAVGGQGATSSNSSSSNLDPVSVNCAASVASSSDSDDDFTLNSVHVVGRLNEVVLELKGLLHGMLRPQRGASGNNGAMGAMGAVGSVASGSSSGNYSGNCSLEPTSGFDRLKLEADLHRSTEQCEKLEMTLKQSHNDIKRKDDEINQQQSKLSVLEVELGAVKEERDQYKSDIDDSELSKDQLIKKAWEVRDAAVKRKNTAEIDLAKERIATMQINSQLLEAIKQKVELSQQLDQWQGDMEQLLEEQMRERLMQDKKLNRPHSSSPLGLVKATSGVAGRSSMDHSPSSSGRTSRLLSIVSTAFSSNKNTA